MDNAASENPSPDVKGGDWYRFHTEGLELDQVGGLALFGTYSRDVYCKIRCHCEKIICFRWLEVEFPR